MAASAAVAGLLAVDEASAEKRVALVIGNSSYQNVVKLDNPFNDASAIAEMFRKASFDSVELKLDLGVIEFKRALRDFYNTTRDADVAVVYYAGHGIEVGGVNYMVPTDAKLRSDYDAEDEAVALERIFRSIESTRRLRLVILDACRDNPFVRTMQRQIASRAVTQGLAKIEPMGTDTLVAYAAKAGSTAEDGAGRNSPFTQALVNNLTIPGLDIRIALGRVRDEVLKRTNNRQEPFVYGSLGGATVSLVPEPEKAPVAHADPRGDYELAERVGTVSAWDAFLAVHGTGFYAELAKQQRSKLAAAVKPDAMTVAALDRSTPPQRPPEEAERATPDRLAWEKLQDSIDPAAIRAFIKRYSTSPLAVVAQTRLEIIERAIADRKREEAERQRLEREAAREAARLREEEDKRAKAAAAEEERRAKAAAAEEARRAKAAAEAEARAQREAARQREEEARLARLSEQERVKAEREAARRRAEEERQAKAAAEAEEKRARAAAEAEAKAQREAARIREEDEKRARAAAEAEAKAQREAALRLEQEKAKAAQPAREPSQEEIVRSAQIELRRLGCYQGDDNGVFNDATRRALLAYRLSTGHGRSESSPTTGELTDLQQQRPIRNCLAALEPPKTPAADRARPEKKKETATRREKPEPKREAKPAPARREPPPARAQATARPAPARSGGGAVMHGIGF
ncbi:caspase family protein [Rhodoplanes sp. TEM]|uniref:Caspase family protein n=1 Tax=Rhodoplanes tepidamans TaxID=200616 RepID=A0ABT5J4S6_RHOTP|nr:MULTISPECIES: caspase family protein [Rhodoplanes]MDC7784634.1 caspase family protein [Rhodoplanes tepidamans]MDC7982926.1 caspase family protein [Rhodoplanes sp. TEM]